MATRERVQGQQSTEQSAERADKGVTRVGRTARG